METFWWLILSVLSIQHAPLCFAQSKHCFLNSIYSFGDSIADTGNLLRRGAAGFLAPIGSFPYGETYKKPTGRCSDGLLMIDYFAINLNISFINPYLDKGGNFDSGVNFAVAGATALDNAFFLDTAINTFSDSTVALSTQLEWFKEHLNSSCTMEAECGKMLGRALFLVGEIGGNDYNRAFFQGRTIDFVKSFVPQVVQSIINATKIVINQGAVQLVVPGNFPIGCAPSYLTMFSSVDTTDYDDKGCLRSYNSFAVYHNEQLQKALEELRQEHPEVTVAYADYYQAYMYLLDNAMDLGFNKDSLLKACCGGGGRYNFDFNVMCGQAGSGTCSDPTKYISWDGFHLTQEAYRIMAESLLMEGFAYPNNNYRIQEQWTC